MMAAHAANNCDAEGIELKLTCSMGQLMGYTEVLSLAMRSSQSFL
jgi:hypothetical protein